MLHIKWGLESTLSWLHKVRQLYIDWMDHPLSITEYCWTPWERGGHLKLPQFIQLEASHPACLRNRRKKQTWHHECQWQCEFWKGLKDWEYAACSAELNWLGWRCGWSSQPNQLQPAPARASQFKPGWFSLFSKSNKKRHQQQHISQFHLTVRFCNEGLIHLAQHAQLRMQ